MSYTNDHTLRVIDIIDGTIVDGPGLRTSIYTAGCKHECPGCHNRQSWDFSAGRDVTIAELLAHVADNQFPVTISGGDPLYQIGPLVELCKALKEQDTNIWIYTGFLYEQVAADAAMSQLLPWIDVLVDGPFVQAKRDIGLRFRGSGNQRLIDVRRSTLDNIIIWTD